MKISVLDASNYFKGLLLLIRKDRTVTQSEIEMMERIGTKLGFEKKFCANAIREILENEHIIDEPVPLSTSELAAMFIRDGLLLAMADKDVHPVEEAWLRAIAEKNGLGTAWFEEERNQAIRRTAHPAKLEIDRVTVVY